MFLSEEDKQNLPPLSDPKIIVAKIKRFQLSVFKIFLDKFVISQ